MLSWPAQLSERGRPKLCQCKVAKRVVAAVVYQL